jgi:hypothetical protein
VRCEVKHTLTFDNVVFEVDPQVGGRVTSFRLGDLDVLSGPDIDALNYGSTFWTSPQSDWGWPPPVEVDCHPYGVAVDHDSLTLTGSPQGALGIAVTKRFSADRSNGAVVLEYSIHNVSSTPKLYAPWEVSRVRSRGLTFFPTGAWSNGSLRVERSPVATWFDHDPSSLTDAGQKSTADGAGGFVAHASQGLLFLKRFADVPPELQAPGEGEIEIYANNRYVEIEVQGPYGRIDVGASASWKVMWYLRRLPVGLVPASGSEELFEFTASVLR